MDEAAAMRGAAAGGRNRKKTKGIPLVGGGGEGRALLVWTIVVAILSFGQNFATLLGPTLSVFIQSA